MTVKLLTERNLKFLSVKGAVQARLNLHLSKCHIVGNLMLWSLGVLCVAKIAENAQK